MTGLIQRLCDEVDPKELPLMYTCLYEEINCCLKVWLFGAFEVVD
jgi:U3 small nucleolar RNA-associated protein 20